MKGAGKASAAHGGHFSLLLERIIRGVEAGATLSRAEAEAGMEELLAGRARQEEIVRLLGAMRARPYAVDELVGFASAMRRHAERVFADGDAAPERLVDTCGTGGDASGTFNISTAAAMVAAAAGARVAKHGNRSVSSRSGSADVLEALGARIELPMERAGAAIRKIGIGFLFAPAAHRATRHAMPARRELGGRTIFNLLGPLTNPAGARAQVLGVFAADVVELVARALAELGAERAFVAHGAGGLDEISLAGETIVAEVRGGRVQRYTVTPEEFGVARAPAEALRGGDAAENAARIQKIFGGERGPARDVVVANAAAALVAAGVAEDFRQGARVAAAAIDSGAAREKLAAFVAFTNA
jgi:anthranilate phosphoribosyltransferase